jgi:hypothetical protein
MSNAECQHVSNGFGRLAFGIDIAVQQLVDLAAPDRRLLRPCRILILAIELRGDGRQFRVVVRAFVSADAAPIDRFRSAGRLWKPLDDLAVEPLGVGPTACA